MYKILRVAIIVCLLRLVVDLLQAFDLFADLL